MPSPPPTPNSASPRDQATRLLAGAIAAGSGSARAEAESAQSDSVDSRMDHVERLFERISNGLTRWLGPYGVHALMTRAVSRVRPAHSALAGVTIAPASDILDRPPTHLTGWHAVARAHGTPAAMDGATAVIESLAEQMGRLIGDVLASTLLEQSAAATDTSRGVMYSGDVRGALRTPSISTAATESRRQADPLPDVLPPDGES